MVIMSKSNLNKVSVSIPANVEIKVDVSFEEYISLLRQSKFVVLPLQNRLISIGQQVLLESMTLGKAVIVTDVVSIRDYAFDGKNALCVKPQDPADLRNKIVSLLNDEELRSWLGNNAKEFVNKNCTIRHYLSKLCQLMSLSV